MYIGISQNYNQCAMRRACGIRHRQRTVQNAGYIVVIANVFIVNIDIEIISIGISTSDCVVTLPPTRISLRTLLHGNTKYCIRAQRIRRSTQRKNDPLRMRAGRRGDHETNERSVVPLHMGTLMRSCFAFPLIALLSFLNSQYDTD